ncbi:hypothetical protein PGR6_17520 [Pseudomonas sp. GR 6-02]|nr:hypothetical protein PGR6_17520 [Pseudomonas sp. GR 6-02]
MDNGALQNSDGGGHMFSLGGLSAWAHQTMSSSSALAVWEVKCSNA